MFLNIRSHAQNKSSPPLLFRIKFVDGSFVKAHVGDVEVQFCTAFGDVRVPLSHILRLKNVSCLQTLRTITRLNKFLIRCEDGSRFIGAPKAPIRLKIDIDGGLEADGSVKFTDIKAMRQLHVRSSRGRQAFASRNSD